jgi:hypothetical protein
VAAAVKAVMKVARSRAFAMEMAFMLNLLTNVDLGNANKLVGLGDL